MTRDTEIAVRRAIASGRLKPEEIAAKYGVNLNSVKALVRDAEKDLAEWRRIGKGRKAA